MSTPVTVLVADDQAVIREGLVLLLGAHPGIAVVGEAGDGAGAVREVARCGPDVVLMDLNMPGVDGITATAAIRAEFPATQVVVLTTYADDESALRALRAGALGFLTKSASREQIARAVFAAAAGQAVLDGDVQRALLEAASRAPRADAGVAARLTERELDVLDLVAAGLSNRQIAQELALAEATVKTHINRIYTKTGCRDREHAARYSRGGRV
ncbi:putative two-component system response regulator [Actinokineospora spheciospongiae]|uniref:Putative two-component system response regulator n=1 Tax=Actinokineospora spheciospongiae TaxID=909613 RepID=W7J7I9_9PSEU|nr:response regulator transcription factor [Actinokineospora spheciospongiae]EWC62024.1 putative two-component system response regulator [Actinokineospora spheciospongiae]PWW60489.1 LuxR family two component transcriptional regulator [Actinokineospora spheciospongiae]